MSNQSLNGVLQHLRKMAAVQTCKDLPDCDLLERFVGAHDDAAFTVLIERHGPMVFGVCRRALPNFQDAEDACQASFLVLARKASSVRKKTSLSSWLHGVACRAAAKLKRDHARRKTRERVVDATVSRDPAAEVTWREVQALLDEELERLPDRYRTPVILCYVESMTREDAAKQLGLSPGSLHGRLERGRQLLRLQLAKRGLTLAAAISAATLGEGIAQAALSPTLVVASSKAAMLLAAGKPVAEGVVANHILVLTQEVLNTMFLTKLKLGAAIALCAGLIAAMIGGSFIAPGIAQDAPFDPRARELVVPSPKAESDADFIRRISRDLRGGDPTPAEVHFFVASKDAGRRQKLIDLFIQERQAKKEASGLYENPVLTELFVRGLRDKQALLGTWTLVEAHRHGNKLALTDNRTKAFNGNNLQVTATLEGATENGSPRTVATKGSPSNEFPHNRHRLIIGSDGKIVMRDEGGESTSGVYELDTTKNPKEITVNWLIQCPAIYKLEGDRLTLCFNCNANLPRPDDFRTTADSDRVMFVYERAEKEKQK